MKCIKFIIIILILVFWIQGLNAEIQNGKILEINKEFNFVIINLGKEEGIKKGMIFLVYREKKLLGKMEVEEVFQDMSSCNMLPWFKQEELKIDDGVLKP